MRESYIETRKHINTFFANETFRIIDYIGPYRSYANKKYTGSGIRALVHATITNIFYLHGKKGLKTEVSIIDSQNPFHQLIIEYLISYKLSV